MPERMELDDFKQCGEVVVIPVSYGEAAFVLKGKEVAAKILNVR